MTASGEKTVNIQSVTHRRLNTNFRSNPPRNTHCYGLKQLDHIFAWSTLL